MVKVPSSEEIEEIAQDNYLSDEEIAAIKYQEDIQIARQKEEEKIIPRFSLQVHELWEAGELYLHNESENTKLLIRAFSPFGSTLYKARQMAKILSCEVFINGVKDDGRYCKPSEFGDKVTQII